VGALSEVSFIESLKGAGT